MTDVLNEYDILFRKFYSDLFKYQTVHIQMLKYKRKVKINTENTNQPLDNNYMILN